MATFTPNKGYSQPVVGSDLNSWGTELNNSFSVMDNNMGGATAVSLASGSVTATSAQAQSLIQNLTGALTANVTYTLPALGSFYFVENNTTGAFTVTVASSGGGTAIVLPQGQSTWMICDGANLFTGTLPLPQVLNPTIGVASISVAGNTNVTITATQAANYALNLTGALTGPINVILPATPGSWFITNSTTGGFTLAIAAPGAGLTQGLPAGQSMVMVSDGTNVFPGMPIGWQTLATYTATNSTAIAIQLPAPFRRFRMSIDTNVSIQGASLQAQFSANGGTNWLSTATYNAIDLTYYSSTSVVGTAAGTTSTPITMPLIAGNNYDATMDIYPYSAGLNWRLNGIGGNATQNSLAGENRVGNNASIANANAMLIFPTSGTFTGAFIVEGLP